MVAPAHAYAAEVAAVVARDRAVCRFTTITAELRARGYTFADQLAQLGDREWRRYIRASTSTRSAFRTLDAAKQRHSEWYRAILRALRRRELLDARSL